MDGDRVLVVGPLHQRPPCFVPRVPDTVPPERTYVETRPSTVFRTDSVCLSSVPPVNYWVSGITGYSGVGERRPPMDTTPPLTKQISVSFLLPSRPEDWSRFLRKVTGPDVSLLDPITLDPVFSPRVPTHRPLSLSSFHPNTLP